MHMTLFFCKLRCDFVSVKDSLTVDDLQVNEYDGPLDFSCPGTSILTRLTSVHNNNDDDRVYVA